MSVHGSVRSRESRVSARSGLSLPDWSETGSRVGELPDRDRLPDAVSARSQRSGRTPRTPRSVRSERSHAEELPATDVAQWALSSPTKKRDEKEKTFGQSGRDPQEWRDLSTTLVRQAQKEMQRTAQLLTAVEAKRAQIDAKAHSVEVAVNEALRKRIAQTKSLEEKLGLQVSRTTQDQGAMLSCKLELEKALDEKETQLALSSKCLEKRLYRPFRELVRDGVEENLEQEHAQLGEARNSYVQGIEKIERERTRLGAIHMAMLADKADKQYALELDMATLQSRLPLKHALAKASREERRQQRR